MLDRTRVARFLVAGSSGFIVDVLLLSALVNGLGWSPYPARVVSYSFALLLTWHLNRTFTFRDRSSPRMGREFVRYLVVQIGGVVVNYGLFAALVATWPDAARWPTLALVPAAAVAMCFTYVGMHQFTFPSAQVDSSHE